MCPHYLETDEGLIRLKKGSKIKGEDGKDLGVIFDRAKGSPSLDAISVSFIPEAQVYVIDKYSALFPGQETAFCDIDFQIVDARTRKTVANIIYSKKPIGKK